MKLHIEFEKADPLVIYVYACISITMPDDEKAQSEKIELEEYLGNIRDIVVENNKEVNNTYYEEQQFECAIEYTRPHC